MAIWIVFVGFTGLVIALYRDIEKLSKRVKALEQETRFLIDDTP